MIKALPLLVYLVLSTSLLTYGCEHDRRGYHEPLEILEVSKDYSE